MEWKKKFIERYSKITDIKKFKQFSSKHSRKSIRINTLKTTADEMKKRLGLKKQIPWCKEGFWISGMSIGNLNEHFLGYIYIQEAASMIPPIILNPNENDIVLDMCASPGSKTTQMAAMMNNSGLIVANDVSFIRLKPLSINIQRCGVTNAIITLMEGRFFKTKFDKILVDAPCSGTGTIRKSYQPLVEWGPNLIRQMAGIQKQLIDTAFALLNENGTLVYSTCSMEPEENEGVIDFLLNKHNNAKLEKININLKSSNPVLEFEGKKYSSEIKKCLRIWPQDNDTDGFFIAKITK